MHSPTFVTEFPRSNCAEHPSKPFRRDAETNARDGRAPRQEESPDRERGTKSDPGSAPVSAAGESVPLSRTLSGSALRRDAETNARDGHAAWNENVRYSKRRLPHFERPWRVYAVTMTTRARRMLVPAERSIVLKALRHFHLRRYELFAACVMPDHVHFLLQPWPKAQNDGCAPIFWSLSELMHSVKSFTAHEINKLGGFEGAVWEEEVFDRYIRSESDLREKFHYICSNPWQSRTVRPEEDYEWIWTQEDDFNPGSAPVSGAGESVPLSRTLSGSALRRDIGTNPAERGALRKREPRTPQT